MVLGQKKGQGWGRNGEALLDVGRSGIDAVTSLAGLNDHGANPGQSHSIVVRARQRGRA